jgi:hypothetical protein
VQLRSFVASDNRDRPERVISRLELLAREALDLEFAAGRRAAAATLAVPGIVDGDGALVAAPNLRWEDVPVTRMVSDSLGPVTVENEANLGALAELIEREGAEALVTGDSLGQVASQTLPNLALVEDAAELKPALQRALLDSNRLGLRMRHDVALVAQPAFLGRNGPVVPAVPQRPEVEPAHPARATRRPASATRVRVGRRG